MSSVPLTALAVLVLAVPLNCQAATDGAVRDVMDRNFVFSTRLYQALASRTDDNVLVSTLSVWRGLAALLGGTGGTTQEQLLAALGLTGLDPQNIPDVLSTLTSGLYLKQGVAVFADPSAQASPSFTDFLQSNYSGEVKSVAFDPPRDAADAINVWVRQQIGDEVQDAVADVDPQAKLLLATAASYQAQFSQAFNASVTQEERFYVDNYHVVMVPMMFRADKYYLAYDRSLKAGVLKLPMTDGTAALVVLPDQDVDIGSVEEAVTEEKIRAWIRQLKKTKLEVQLPRFFLDRSYSLKDVLGSLDMVQIFQDDADLSKLGAAPGLKLSQVLHKAVATIDEGSQGATLGGGASVFSTPPPRLTINRPFLFLVYHQSSGGLLLMGRVRDPTKK
ncbi:plasma serine protease inhibitor [Syngnathus scovelli]|uniref:plasma serine protease inhibitor n=1 Tax=Syngnathus scovelli TaxID=161590 RepID=UPI0021104E58|nr:serine protease inhibitor 2.1 [Syngnathus scovelli]